MIQRSHALQKQLIRKTEEVRSTGDIREILGRYRADVAHTQDGGGGRNRSEPAPLALTMTQARTRTRTEPLTLTLTLTLTLARTLTLALTRALTRWQRRLLRHGRAVAQRHHPTQADRVAIGPARAGMGDAGACRGAQLSDTRGSCGGGSCPSSGHGCASRRLGSDPSTGGSGAHGACTWRSRLGGPAAAPPPPASSLLASDPVASRTGAAAAGAG